jgi:hypothetical protein
MDRLCGLVVRVSGYRSRGPGFVSRRFQIFWETPGLERGPFSLVRTTEELFEGKVAAPVWKTGINDRGNRVRWPRDTLYPQKLVLTSPTNGSRSVGIVRSRTKATEFSFSLVSWSNEWISNLVLNWVKRQQELIKCKLSMMIKPWVISVYLNGLNDLRRPWEFSGWSKCIQKGGCYFE